MEMFLFRNNSGKKEKGDILGVHIEFILIQVKRRKK